jgi:tRNA (guanine37-N1)-methyltransferase
VRVDVVTLFPELFETFSTTSLTGRATESGTLSWRFKSPREFGLGVHRKVDDTPYGGGSGLVMRADVLVDCMEAMDADAGAAAKAHRILLTPQGKRFHQTDAARLASKPALMFICGRYEGFDERVRSFVDEELSLGDFVMMGGEVAAMAMIEATVRLLPGVLGNLDSIREESHQKPLLEYAQYTKPVEFRGMVVPEIVRSGNHQAIEAHRRKDAETRTAEKRPDLLTEHDKASKRP